MRLAKHKGIICGILAAVCYGTNPFGALPLYEEGVNTASVLFYRFAMAVAMLTTMGIIFVVLSAVLLIVLGKNFHLKTIKHTISTIVRKTWRWKS